MIDYQLDIQRYLWVSANIDKKVDKALLSVNSLNQPNVHISKWVNSSVKNINKLYITTMYPGFEEEISNG